MGRFQIRLSLSLVLVIAFSSLSHGSAIRQEEEVDQEANDSIQEVLTFEVVVINSEGEPVKDAEVTPWAIGSAQGHGAWNEKAAGGVKAEAVMTDSSGKATIRYPKFSNVAEEVRSTTISVAVKHPEYPVVNDIHVGMPAKKPHKVKLPTGSMIEATVLLDGEPVVGDEIKANWTTGASWTEDSGVQIDQDQKTIRTTPIPKGIGQVMFVRLDGDTITHFSAIEDIEIDGTEKLIKKSVELVPAVTIRGKLSDEVPRPVISGRVKFQTITDGRSWDEISWFDWAQIEEDGSFVIDAWPKGEPMQLTALCDGFCAKNGEKPPMVTPERARGSYMRAQVFLEPENSEITVEMEPMSSCRIEVNNAFGKKLSGVTAGANPNIGWWNGGSQIYCWPLVGGVEFLKTGKYNRDRKDGIHTQPFSGKTDEDGFVTIQLPARKTNLWIGNERYQLAAKAGRRSRRIEVEQAKSMSLEFVLQPKGLDVLGDWEDLCGLVFG